MLAVLDSRHHLPFGRPVAQELSGDHDTPRPGVPLQQLAQLALGGSLVASALDQHIEHHPGLIHGAPESVLHPANRSDGLVEVPLVPGAG